MKNERGFSLVEMLIAITLLAIGLLAVAGMQSTAINANSFANKLSTATALAQEVMEDLLARDSTAAIFQADTNDNVYDLDPDTAATSITITGAGTFTAAYDINADSPATNVATISVTVTTTGRIVTLTSYKRAV